MMDSLLRYLVCAIASFCVYMILRNHREGKFGLSAFWVAPFLAALRGVFA